MEIHVGLMQNANGQELPVQQILVMQMLMKQHVEQHQNALGLTINAL